MIHDGSQQISTNHLAGRAFAPPLAGDLLLDRKRAKKKASAPWRGWRLFRKRKESGGDLLSHT
jgi:hypothetical protein